jgi:hypothetical protein
MPGGDDLRVLSQSRFFVYISRNFSGRAGEKSVIVSNIGHLHYQLLSVAGDFVREVSPSPL